MKITRVVAFLVGVGVCASPGLAEPSGSLSVLGAGAENAPYPIRCMRRAGAKQVLHNAGRGMTKYLVNDPDVAAACQAIISARSFACVARYRDEMTKTPGTIEEHTGAKRRLRMYTIAAMPLEEIHKCAQRH